ncbi:glycoside hydrolase family 16 protein [Bacillus sp. 1P06AnD]|uniref:glycoside hydrolase family 16 protein n=1 Tax=Bacillus sp. 1P06AnD TaxID=3132208 RepID=UPI0039A094EE
MNLKKIGVCMGLLFTSLIFSEIKVGAYERQIRFADHDWEVRNNISLEGPGPNYFSDSASNVWVDSSGQLHMKLTYRNGKWQGAEVINKNVLGYGKYTFFIDSKLDNLDSNVVLGLFTYDMESSDAHLKGNREIDIEFAKWGHDNSPNTQYTIWEKDSLRSFKEFNVAMPDGSWSTHSFDWQPQKINFESLGGHYINIPHKDFIWKKWTYTNEKVPDEGMAKIHMNLWLANGKAPQNGLETEIIISNFIFTPYNQSETIDGDSSKTEKYTLSTGTFTGKNSIENAKQKFEALTGLTASHVEEPGKMVYRLQTGSFPSYDSAKKALLKLKKEAGLTGRLVEIDAKIGKNYRIVLDQTYSSQKITEEKTRSLKAKFNWVFTYSQTGTETIYRIKLENLQEAEAKRIKKLLENELKWLVYCNKGN